MEEVEQTTKMEGEEMVAMVEKELILEEGKYNN